MPTNHPQLRQHILTRPPVTIATAVSLLAILFVFALIIGNGIALVTVGTPLTGFGNGDSMQPTISDGDIIIYNPAPDTSTIEYGDIVRFETADGQTITHRVVSEQSTSPGETAYLTQGDNNPHLDQRFRAEAVSPDAVKGTYIFHIENGAFISAIAVAIALISLTTAAIYIYRPTLLPRSPPSTHR